MQEIINEPEGRKKFRAAADNTKEKTPFLMDDQMSKDRNRKFTTHDGKPTDIDRKAQYDSVVCSKLTSNLPLLVIRGSVLRDCL